MSKNVFRPHSQRPPHIYHRSKQREADRAYRPLSTKKDISLISKKDGWEKLLRDRRLHSLPFNRTKPYKKNKFGKNPYRSPTLPANINESFVDCKLFYQNRRGLKSKLLHFNLHLPASHHRIAEIWLDHKILFRASNTLAAGQCPRHWGP